GWLSFFFQAEDGIRDFHVTGVQTCALPISSFGSALVALIPIPVSDLLPMTAIQTAMILKIARAFGFSINRSRARELLPMLAAGRSEERRVGKEGGCRRSPWH